MLQKLQAIRRFAAKAANASVNYVRTTYIAMWALILICTIYGCMLIHSARPIAIKTQIMAAMIGFGGAFIISLMDYHRLGQLWPLVGGACVFLVGLTFVVGQSAIGGNAVADDVAWLNIFGYSFQPSELMKIGFIVTFSYHLSYVVEKNTLNTLSSVFMLGGHALVPVGLCILQGGDGIVPLRIQFIQQLRNEAVELYLVYSDLDLASISDRTGYTDCSHMVKDFRRMTGMTPGQYRSSMKIQGFAPFSRFSALPAPIHPPKG